jgi:glycosyltransferase involved in cell wall biosynthesis
MRVVLASTLENGGPVSHLRYLVPRVAASGADVTLLCQSERVAEDFEPMGIRVHVVPVGGRLDVRGAWRLRPHLERADVVHTHDRRAGLYARTLAAAAGARVVHTVHGLPEEIANRVGTSMRKNLLGSSRLRVAWLMHGYLRIEAILSRLGCVVTPSCAMAQFLVEHGVPRRRVVVIPSGIDSTRSETKPLHEPPIVGTAANLERWKGVDTLIEACSAVPRRLRVEIWGDGTQRRALERRAHALNVDAVFHGRVPDARDAIGRLDVFVLPSRAENLPLSVLEAMSAAVPVVVTKVGGVPEIVTDGVTGLVVEPDDPHAMASAITVLTTNEQERRAIGAAGARAVTERFGADEAGARLIRLYEELCASSR